jgi:hypothetical protein
MYTAQQQSGRNELMGQYSNVMQSLADNLLGSTGDATNAYTNRMTELQQPAFNIGIGGQQIGVTPRRNSMLAEMAANTYGADVSQANRYNDVYTNLANLDLQRGEMQLPGTSELAALQTMWPYLSQMQNLRYNLPTTTQTATYSPTMLESLAQGLELGQGISDLFNNSTYDPQTQSEYYNSYYG